ncbi:MAG: hypothetical protein KDJ35_03775 [Alphaproteobacteria bacterium]|nr:hypothetical protein [Alphaproteobacteria bacterium]
MSIAECDELLKRYLDVCNQALVLNGERFPFKQILGAAQRSEKGRKIELWISDTPPTHSYVMSIDQGRIVAAPHGECADCQCDRRWTVSREYLQEVATHPDVYIGNPAKINWEWMYNTRR